jgi:hypothetical protein
MISTTPKSNLFKKTFFLRLFFWLLALLLGFLQASTYRFDFSSDDIIAYLDIGEAYLKGDWNAAINGYWSPFYSWILGLVFAIFKPSSYWEIFWVKLVNLLIFFLAILSFDFFLRQLIIFYERNISKNPFKRIAIAPEWTWIVLGYTLFIWASLKWIGIQRDNPDLLVSAIIYLAAALILRIQINSHWLNFLLLGVVLGFGYLAKTVMFPLAFVFGAIAAVSTANLRLALPKILATLLIFLLIVSPFITAISFSKNRFTFGDSGKLNYAWTVIGGMQAGRYWTGEDKNSGTPKHPPRKIFQDPKVFEFATPLAVTYPLWHDPSYWYEGLQIKSNSQSLQSSFSFTDSLKKPLETIGKNLVYYYYLFLGFLIFGYLILISVSGNIKLSIKNVIAHWRLLVLAMSGLGGYAIAIRIPETRYIAPFIVLLFAAIFFSVNLPARASSKRLIAGMAIATFILVGSQLILNTPQDLTNLLRGPKQHLQWKVADRLEQLGIREGDRLAILGMYFAPSHHWAKLAKVKIIAEIPDGERFWAKNANTRRQALEIVKKTGAKAIVQKPNLKIPNKILDIAFSEGWQKLGDTGYSVYFLAK